MEYRKQDMYQKAGRAKVGDWVQVTPPGESEPEAKKIEVIVVKPPEVSGVMPEVPEAGPGSACGYCITPAMCYVPMQKWNETYEAELALSRGTIFPELDLPFVGEGACRDD